MSKRFIPIAVAAAMLAAIAFVAPSPASADHDDPNLTNYPCTTGDGLDPPLPAGCNGAAFHEEMPEFAQVDPRVPCLVTGQVVPGTPTANGPQHQVKIDPQFGLVNGDPAHSHFEFVEAIISCPDTGDLEVGAEGGNDGHMIDDYYQPTDPGFPCGPNGDCLELDPVTGPDCNGACGREHDFNDHHGSVNESAWSNSSGYSGGLVAGDSNACGNPNGNNNKFDIALARGANTEAGWGKYIRIGVVLYVWGCFDPSGAGLITGANPFFTAKLLITPDVSPVAVPPFTPGGATPLCLLGPPNPTCGFLVDGVAARGPGWLLDTDPLND